MPSPGIGWQQRAKLTIRLSTPATRTPLVAAAQQGVVELLAPGQHRSAAVSTGGVTRAITFWWVISPRPTAASSLSSSL